MKSGHAALAVEVRRSTAKWTDLAVEVRQGNCCQNTAILHLRWKSGGEHRHPELAVEDDAEAEAEAEAEAAVAEEEEEEGS